jgi:hypothetical protein
MKRNWAGVAGDVKRGYPLSDAAIKLVAWATHGVLRPSGDDFAMLRLVLLALLPQIGGKTACLKPSRFVSISSCPILTSAAIPPRHPFGLAQHRLS